MTGKNTQSKFLSRSPDLKRNSIVSLFLKVLELYDGVLFLTTNRVGTVDSAVASRKTLSTYYPPLNEVQTREIWKTNLGRLRDRNHHIRIVQKDTLSFAKQQFQAATEDKSSWNGRQIENTFKVAKALAESDGYSSEEQGSMDTTMAGHQQHREVELTSSHFRAVTEANDQLQRYLLEATGSTESQRAFSAQERADSFVDDDTFDTSDSNSNEVTEKPAPRRKRLSSSALYSKKQKQIVGACYGQDRATLATVGQSSYTRWQSGPSSVMQQPHPEHSSDNSMAEGAAAKHPAARMKGADSLSRPSGLLGSAAGAMIGTQSLLPPAKKRKRDEEPRFFHGKKDSADRQRLQQECLRFDSDSDNSHVFEDGFADEDFV